MQQGLQRQLELLALQTSIRCCHGALGRPQALPRLLGVVDEQGVELLVAVVRQAKHVSVLERMLGYFWCTNRQRLLQGVVEGRRVRGSWYSEQARTTSKCSRGRSAPQLPSFTAQRRCGSQARDGSRAPGPGWSCARRACAGAARRGQGS